MTVSKEYMMDEEKFQDMLNEFGFQVVVLGVDRLPDETMKKKIGQRKIVKYREGTMKGQVVPNAYADVSYEDVFKDFSVKKSRVRFKFLKKEDENKFLGV